VEKTHDVTIDYASQQQQRPYLCIFDSVRWIHLAFVKMLPGRVGSRVSVTDPVLSLAYIEHAEQLRTV